MAHILNRALIHFFASCGIVVCSLFIVQTLARRFKWPWLPGTLQPQLVFVAVCVFAVAALCEAFDVAAGQSIGKAVADYASWAAGCGCSVWALWRIAKL